MRGLGWASFAIGGYRDDGGVSNQGSIWTQRRPTRQYRESGTRG